MKMRSLASSTPQLTPASRSLFNSEERNVGLRKKRSTGLLSSTTTPVGARSTRITATTATASRSTTPPSRHLLKPHDHNVASTTRALAHAPTPTLHPPPTTSPKMPPEKTSGPNSSRQSPIPTLAKGLGKQPITPKIATRTATATTTTTTTTTTQHQTVTVAATPLGRRPARPESTLSSSNGSGALREKEDVASPVVAFLNSNITPRSGSRQSRVDGTNTTPGGTPVPDRSDLWEARPNSSIWVPSADDAIGRPAVTLSSPPEASGAMRHDTDSKFFYASDAPKPAATQQQKTPAFFYANGEVVPTKQDAPPPGLPTNAPAAPGSTLPQDGLMGKFVYACGMPGQPSSVNATTVSPQLGPAAVALTPSRLSTNKPATITILSPACPDPRPTSPVKQPTYPVVKSPGTSQSAVTPRSPVTAPISLAAPLNLHRSSGGISSRLASSDPRSRNNSIISTDASTVSRLISSAHNSHPSYPSSGASSPSSTTPNHLALGSLVSNTVAASGFASLLQAAEDFAEDGDAHSEVPHGTTKPSSQGDQLDELVASARRERKDQDIQIRNASLEAINRTLERQLRKQTAELRRYRRLSRSGRLSLVSAPTPDRIVSDSSMDGGALARAGMDLDDLSEQEDEDAEEEVLGNDDEFSDSDTGSGELGSSEPALRDARHRERDEKRLQLDLSKHRQLLVDSQKMNQSLRRCLSWTEELIREGRRALEYQVRVSEVQIGGRVLAPEDVESQDAGYDAADDDDRGGVIDGETNDGTIHGADWHPDSTLDALDTIDSQKQWGHNPQDRDSGVELPGDGG